MGFQTQSCSRDPFEEFYSKSRCLYLLSQYVSSSKSLPRALDGVGAIDIAADLLWDVLIKKLDVLAPKNRSNTRDFQVKKRARHLHSNMIPNVLHIWDPTICPEKSALSIQNMFLVVLLDQLDGFVNNMPQK